ncbi:MarR family winged helix-turn-helix transcriptional regulator [Kiloniella sp. EL199]|uniref:MarR family winged helix-turn-helix transcriptional regulator n=1 Tax=Kiloniella sp. EL199 TaxID=2107581 RepID=UPI0013C405A7|nr:MarR family winged helix-turn-helix transcriptional regulator [Kiloniella sp. EL199]
MSLTNSLDQFHRYLTCLWTDISDRPNALTCSEYGYLRAIERLDGDKLAQGEGCRRSDGHGHHLQDIVELLKIKKASASVAVTKLEKRGLIERFQCQHDARAQHIVLTEKARKYLREEEAIYKTSAKDIAKVLTVDELKAFEASLAKINKAL